MFEVTKQPMNISSKIIEFEIIKRASEIRIIIVKENQLLSNREFLVQDPDGYLLRFFQDLGAKIHLNTLFRPDYTLNPLITQSSASLFQQFSQLQ